MSGTGQVTAAPCKIDSKIEAPVWPSVVENMRKTGHKSSSYRGVTLFRPTMKWRAQISSAGKTTSLGDHDTEADAARAFDRALINKLGGQAKTTNFPISDYDSEIEDLTALDQAQMVAMLRSKARKSSTQTSHYRGVSLLKQTGSWHAQINVCGRQVHLGFFPTEIEAARAYDRSAINKGARDGGKIVTNMSIEDYASELDILRRVKESALVEALSHSNRRSETASLLASGDLKQASIVFGDALEMQPDPKQVRSVPEILARAERCQPKPTEANPLYSNFALKKEGAAASLLFSSPVKKLAADTPDRWAVKPRVLFSKRARHDAGDDSETETDDDALPCTTNLAEQTEPQRRSTRNRGKPAKRYQLALADIYGLENDAPLKITPPESAHNGIPETPALHPDSPDIKPRSFKHSRDGDSSEDEGAKVERKRRKLKPVPVEPAEVPSWEMLADAVNGFTSVKRPHQSADFQSLAGTSGLQEPSESPKVEGASQAVTLESKAPPLECANSMPLFAAPDNCSKAVAGSGVAEDKASVLSVHCSDAGLSEVVAAVVGVPSGLTTQSDAGCVTELETPHAQKRVYKPQPGPTFSRGAEAGAAPAPTEDGFGRKGSNLATNLAANQSRVGDAREPAMRGSQEDSVGGAFNRRPSLHTDSTAPGHTLMPDLPTPGIQSGSKRNSKRKSEMDLGGVGKQARPTPATEEDKEGNLYAKTFTARPRTSRQRAMIMRRLQHGNHQVDATEHVEVSPRSSFAANGWTSGCWSAAAKIERGVSAGPQDDVASQSSKQQASAQGKARSTSGPLSAQNEASHAGELRRRNRRKFCKPLRAGC